MKLELEKIIEHHYGMIQAHNTALRASKNPEQRAANLKRIQYHQRVIDALHVAHALIEEPT